MVSGKCAISVAAPVPGTSILSEIQIGPIFLGSEKPLKFGFGPRPGVNMLLGLSC